MTWNYDPSQLHQPINHVRLLVGDTQKDRPLLQDEEIEHFLEETSNTFLAAAEVAEAIHARFPSTITSKGADGKTISYQLTMDYGKLARRLRAKAARMGKAMPVAGGISKSDKEKQEARDDRDASSIRRGMHDKFVTDDPLRPG
jgi:hypothetical protein